MQNLILLHGAIGAAEQLKPLAEHFNTEYKVHSFDFSAHGSKPFPSEPLSIGLFAEETVEFMDQAGLEKASVFGYSMGGYVAMYLARYHPARVDKVVTLATKFHWDSATAAREVLMIDAEKLEAKLPAFVEVLRKRHEPNDWKALLARTAEMLESMGRNNPLKLEDYKEVAAPSLVLLGDRDKMITLEETVEVFRSLPAGQMGMLPSTPHPIEQVNMKALVLMVKQFLG
jgi:pimeloyl-ACP methyl ester carboxylesterase